MTDTTIASLEAKLREAEAREGVYLTALSEIAEQHIGDEIGENREDADFEYGYTAIVGIARAAIRTASSPQAGESTS